MTNQMSYLRTHPWITFAVNWEKCSPKLWMTLGEAKSKCDHLAGTPLEPEVQESLHILYLAKGVHATTAIEGNTLSEKEVKDRIEGKLDLPPSREYLGREADNIVKGCNTITQNLMEGGSIDLDVEEIKKFNDIVLEGLKLSDKIVAGEIRCHDVGVARYRGAPPEDCEHLLMRMCEWLNESRFKEPDNFVILGILRAILAHLYIAWIHPFGDGNGRTARLLEFKILLGHGIPSAAAHLLSNHYNLTRNEYYRQLDESSRSGGEVFPFIYYAAEGFVDGLREQINLIRGEQLRITWRNFVYDIFKNKSGSTNERRRKLVLDMSERLDPIPFKEIRRTSPRVAEFYAKLTDRAVRRDVNALVDMQLLLKTEKGFIVNTRRMLAFLPARRREEQSKSI